MFKNFVLLTRFRFKYDLIMKNNFIEKKCQVKRQIPCYLSKECWHHLVKTNIAGKNDVNRR